MNSIRSLVKRLPHPILCRGYHYTRLREESARAAKVAAAAGLPLLEALDLLSLRASDTLFILGSAWSINEISDERWRVIGRCDSVGMNFWLAHPFVPRFLQFEDIAFGQQPEMHNAFLTLVERRADAYAGTVKIVTEVNPIGSRQTIFELPDVMKKNLYAGFSMPVVARTEEELRAGIRFMNSVGAFSQRGRTAWLFKYGGSVIAMMTLGVLMGYKRIVLCGVDLNRQDYFYQDRERYPEYADWEFVPRNEVHRTTRRLPWLVPAQSAVCIFKELVLDPKGIELFVESRASTLYPKVPLASQSLFDELGDVHIGAAGKP
jgi:hypothetical protein